MKKSPRGIVNKFQNSGICPGIFELFERDDAVGERCRAKVVKFEEDELAGGDLPFLYRSGQTTVGGSLRRVIYEHHVVDVFKQFYGGPSTRGGLRNEAQTQPSAHYHCNVFVDNRHQLAEVCKGVERKKDNKTNSRIEQLRQPLIDSPPAPMRDRDVAAQKRKERASLVARANLLESTNNLPRRTVAKMTCPAPPRRSSPRVRILLERVESLSPSPTREPIKSEPPQPLDKENVFSVAIPPKFEKSPDVLKETVLKTPRKIKKKVSFDVKPEVLIAPPPTLPSSELPREKKRRQQDHLDDSTFAQPPPKKMKLMLKEGEVSVKPYHHARRQVTWASNVTLGKRTGEKEVAQLAPRGVEVKVEPDNGQSTSGSGAVQEALKAGRDAVVAATQAITTAVGDGTACIPLWVGGKFSGFQLVKDDTVDLTHLDN